MAYTATGSWVGGDDWYAWLNVSKSNTSDTVTKVTVTGGIYNVYAVASYFTADITSDSAGNTTNYSVGSISEYSGEKTVKTNNINVTRGTSQKTLTVMCRVNGSGGYSGSSSTAKTTVTIPAKTSYTITYNANGGTGAPPNQTKWYGDALTLSTTVPTRTDYNFKGWNTAADGTGTYSYNAGGSYPADRNGNVTLYAQWELAYARPTISDLSLIRCTNASGYPASEEGTYAKLSFKWAFDTHASSGTYAVQWREVGQTNWNNDRSGTLSGNTGTFAYTLLTKSTFSASTSYQIQLTITDGNKPEYSTSVITVLTQGFAHIVLGGPNHPHSVGIGKTPTANELLDVGINTNIDGTLTVNNISPLEGVEIVGTVLDNNNNEVLLAFRFGPIIMIQIRGVVANTGTIIADGICANYKPKQNASTILGTGGSGNNTSDGKNHYCRCWVSAEHGSISLEYVDYSGPGKWYGTLTYILDTANASLS